MVGIEYSEREARRMWERKRAQRQIVLRALAVLTISIVLTLHGSEVSIGEARLQGWGLLVDEVGVVIVALPFLWPARRLSRAERDVEKYEEIVRSLGSQAQQRINRAIVLYRHLDWSPRDFMMYGHEIEEPETERPTALADALHEIGQSLGSLSFHARYARVQAVSDAELADFAAAGIGLIFAGFILQMLAII